MQIAAVLQERPDVPAVAEQLLAIERDWMALPNPAAAAEVRRTVENAIVQWYEDSRARWWELGPRPRSRPHRIERDVRRSELRSRRR